MEPDSQHLYGARVDSAPCGWSCRGCDMGRLISRCEGGPGGPRLRSLERGGPSASGVVQSVGAAGSTPHCASVAQTRAFVPFRVGLYAGMVF